jgi:broad specificity phosphatase PhoE
MTSGLLLVRHTEIAERYQGVCYGASDVELSANGIRNVHEVASRLAALPVTRIVHSGLTRTRILAECLGQLTNLAPICCAGLRERDFGAWELQSWNAIFEQQGDKIARIISEPESYRPGGGETTFEMRDRIAAAFRTLPRDGLTVVVTHGGPIAVFLGTQQNLPVPEWLTLIPAYGEIVHATQTL